MFFFINIKVYTAQKDALLGITRHLGIMLRLYASMEAATICATPKRKASCP